MCYLGTGWYLAHHVWEKNYRIQTEKEVGNLKVAVFSDSHVGTTFHGKGFAEHMKTIEAQNPDVVLVVGDFVDDDTTKPGIHFHFYSGDAVDVSERLNHDSLDFAVMLEPIDNIKYNFSSLPDCSEWGILMKKNDPLATKKALTKDDMKTIPLIMHQRIGLQNEIAHWAGTDLENLNIAATYKVVHGSPVPFVMHGMGYFLTTRDLLAPTLDPDVCFLPLEPKLPTKVALVWKKHAVFSKVSEIFINTFKQKYY